MRKHLPTLLGLAAVAAAGVGLHQLIEARTLQATEALGESSEARALPVETRPLRYTSAFTTTRRFTGTVEARRRAELTFEGTGRVAEILVDDGEGVTEGAPLARLDVRQLVAERAEIEARRVRLEAQLAELVAGPRAEVVDAAQASVAALTEELALARQLQERRAELAARGSVSAEQLDTSRAAVRTLEARLEGAQARLAELENGSREETVAAQRGALGELDASLASMDVRIERGTLLAPFAGTVEARLLDEGAVVSQQMPRTAFVLVETGALEVRVGLPGGVVAEVEEDPAALDLRFGGARLPVRSIRALPVVDPGTRTVTVVLDLDAAAARAAGARPGDVVTLRVPVEQAERGAWVPIAALSESQRGLWSAYVLEPTPGGGAVARRAELEVLHVESDRAYVRGTVPDGARIIASGAHRVTAGQAVEDRAADGPSGGER